MLVVPSCQLPPLHCMTDNIYHCDDYMGVYFESSGRFGFSNELDKQGKGIQKDAAQ